MSNQNLNEDLSRIRELIKVSINEHINESASSLRQVAISKYGWKEKGSELSSGGELNSDFVDILNELIEEFDKIKPNCKGTFTSGNDKFHHKITDYTSRHTKGEAVDLVLPSECRSDFMNLMDKFKQKYNGFSYLDEYTRPTKKATGGHFHLSYRGGQPEGKSSEPREKDDNQTSDAGLFGGLMGNDSELQELTKILNTNVGGQKLKDILGVAEDGKDENFMDILSNFLQGWKMFKK